MSNTSNSATLADVHKIMSVLKKYSDSQTVQKILLECFDKGENQT